MALAAALAVMVIAPTSHAEESGDDSTKLLWGFEAEDESITVKGNGSFVAEEGQVTEGENALQVVATAGEDYLGINIVESPVLEGWDGYSKLKVDVYNPGDKAVPVTVRVDDALSSDSKSRVAMTREVKPGAQTVTVPLAALVCKDGRKLDLGMLYKLYFFVYKPAPDTTLVFDNLRLEKQAQALPP